MPLAQLAMPLLAVLAWGFILFEIAFRIQVALDRPRPTLTRSALVAGAALAWLLFPYIILVSLARIAPVAMGAA